MIIEMQTIDGKLIEVKIQNETSFREADKLWSNELFNVISVKKEVQGTLSNYEACQIIANEGIGYAVQRYVSGNEFKDHKTAELWDEADNALENLLQHLDYDNFEVN